MQEVARPATVAGPRIIGMINWIGFSTLYQKEVKRFIKVYTQTIAAPVVTTLLFYAVFALALGGSTREVGGVPFLEFLAPGLIMMSMAQNAFANTSSSVVISKVQGNIVDVLMPPLSPVELMLGYVLGGVTRGLLVGVVSLITIRIFVPLSLPHPFFVLFHGLMASTMLSLIGIMGGIWSEKFDHIAAVTNFIVQPLAFLSGTFYSIGQLPVPFWWVAHFNPFFYMIDGFRFGFTGHSDGTLMAGLVVMSVANTTLLWFCYRMLATGYRLKA